MRQILIITLAYGITPALMGLTVVLAWWMANRRDDAPGEEER
ncbi:MAG: hypothetical protein M5R38_02340 [Candidatus Methylomirabilis sp.]|nr:hypothetical protein [Candidatus Methylomirabilis sp.]